MFFRHSRSPAAPGATAPVPFQLVPCLSNDLKGCPIAASSKTSLADERRSSQQHLVAAHRSMPLFTIGTYRDVELGVTRPFARTLETLLRERRVTRIVLRRLPVEGVESMLAGLSGHPPPPSLARVIFNDTEGNPFFVEEVFQHLREASFRRKRDLRKD